MLKFNCEIYSKKAICKAIADFSHVALFSVRWGKRDCFVKINNKKIQKNKQVASEFANYVLGLTKKFL